MQELHPAAGVPCSRLDACSAIAQPSSKDRLVIRRHSIAAIMGCCWADGHLHRRLFVDLLRWISTLTVPGRPQDCVLLAKERHGTRGEWTGVYSRSSWKPKRKPSLSVSESPAAGLRTAVSARLLLRLPLCHRHHGPRAGHPVG